jgi:hypothetical protein
MYHVHCLDANRAPRPFNRSKSCSLAACKTEVGPSYAHGQEDDVDI